MFLPNEFLTCLTGIWTPDGWVVNECTGFAVGDVLFVYISSAFKAYFYSIKCFKIIVSNIALGLDPTGKFRSANLQI